MPRELRFFSWVCLFIGCCWVVQWIMISHVEQVNWLREKMLINNKPYPYEKVRQDEFIRMLMLTYGINTDESTTDVELPKEVKDNPTASYYAMAKRIGVFDCSCEMKPESYITHGEAAKFVMLAINNKFKQQLFTWEDAQEWVGGELESELNYLRAALLLKQMDGFVKEQNLKEIKV